MSFQSWCVDMCLHLYMEASLLLRDESCSLRFPFFKTLKDM